MTANVIPFTRPHTIAELLAQILIDQAKLEKLGMASLGREPTEAEDAQWSALDDAIWMNREELRKLVRDRLGVSFEQLSEAGL